MSRILLSPLTEVASAIPSDIATGANPGALRILREGIADALQQRLLFPAGTALVAAGQRRQVKDAGWAGDIENIVVAAGEHQVVSRDPVSGLYVVVTETVKLLTLRAEVDDNGEICAWIYENS